MSWAAACTPETRAGLPCFSLRLHNGDTVRISRFGAQVLSWTAAGRERLFLSGCSRFDGRSAIRGGVPLCWPQFNQRGNLPKHGFARQIMWKSGASRQMDDAIELDFHLQDTQQTRLLWPHAFHATVTVRLAPACLRVTLDLCNSGLQPWAFTGALHTYLAVDSVDQARLTGLGGQAQWDAVNDVHGQAASELRFQGEFDRVYSACTQDLALDDGPHRLIVRQSPSWPQVVVWNPGQVKGDALTDMAVGDWRHMLCIEAAQVFTPKALEPGAQWQAWQELAVA